MEKLLHGDVKTASLRGFLLGLPPLRRTCFQKMVLCFERIGEKFKRDDITAFQP
jgi:hypothetical protein